MRRQRSPFSLLILLVTLMFLATVQGYPLVWSVMVSLLSRTIGNRGRFIGLGNYRHLLSDTIFWGAIWFTVFYAVIAVILKLLLGLVMAMALNKNVKGRLIFRALLFLPWALPNLTSILAWRWMLGDVGGVFNYLLVKLGVIDRPVGWLAVSNLARMSVILVNVWRGIPFFGISILAALQSIPEYLYEAAIIDGAGAWRKFVAITIPSIYNAVLLVTLISTIWTLGDFAIIWLMTRGGPANATHVFSTLSYITAFKNLELSQGVAISLFIVPALVGLMTVTMRFILRKGD
jgi:multiple sugar transport system permease protein